MKKIILVDGYEVEQMPYRDFYSFILEDRSGELSARDFLLRKYADMEFLDREILFGFRDYRNQRFPYTAVKIDEVVIFGDLQRLTCPSCESKIVFLCIDPGSYFGIENKDLVSSRDFEYAEELHCPSCKFGFKTLFVYWVRLHP